MLLFSEWRRCNRASSERKKCFKIYTANIGGDGSIHARLKFFGGPVPNMKLDCNFFFFLKYLIFSLKVK